VSQLEFLGMNSGRLNLRRFRNLTLLILTILKFLSIHRHVGKYRSELQEWSCLGRKKEFRENLTFDVRS
jgi:hypothetical protein